MSTSNTTPSSLHIALSPGPAPRPAPLFPAWLRCLPFLLLYGWAAACSPVALETTDPAPSAAMTRPAGSATPQDRGEGMEGYPGPARDRSRDGAAVGASGAEPAPALHVYHLPLIVQPNPANVDLSRFAGASAEGAGNDAPGDVGTAAAPPGACAGIAVRQGDALAIDGHPFVFFGVNARYLMDEDFPEAEVEPILARLRERGVNSVRVWFFHDEDPERFQRLLDAGGRQGIRFVVTFSDNVHKGVDWFFGEEDEEEVRPHVERTVARFRDRPEILLWEPANEPNCGDGRFDDACLDTLRDWLQTMARRIKRIDPCRVVSTSMIGAGNFENEQASYRKLHRKDVVEVFSAHRRTTDEGRLELEMAADAGRPIVYGEIYDEAYDEGCQPRSGDRSPAARAERVKDDLRAAVEAGVDGYLLWDLAVGRVRKTNGDDEHYCSRFGFEWDDPVWEKLQGSEGLPPQVPW